MTTYDANGLFTGATHTMRTLSGQHIDPFTMTAADVVPVDIVTSLANQCRFGGHTAGWLSVARHSIHVAEWVERHYDMTQDDALDIVLAGLLHDAAEAYIGDIIRPLKHREEFSFFRELDDQVTMVILERFQVKWRLTDRERMLHVLPEIVHEADREVTNAEVHYLRHDRHLPWTPLIDAADFRTALYRHRPEDFR